jgi:hypothetical protein
MFASDNFKRMKENETNNGKKGGLLKGKPHYDKDGKPLGGIKAIVTDSDKPVELEGGEVIINKEASKKHWKELSRINQSAGNGVPIAPPDGADEDPEEYKDGGKVIEFNRNHIPSANILKYAEKIKKNHPDVWKKGGNIFGNQAFENLKRVQQRGYWLDSEKWMYIKWRSYVARHIHDFRIEGVIAMLKWVDKVEKGWAYMKDLIEEQIKKKEGKSTDKKEDGGNVDAQDISARWSKKRNAIQILTDNIQSLRYSVTKDLQSDDERIFLTALVIAIIDNTAERVGNEESAFNGHIGVTGLKNKNVKIVGDKITLSYVGKSGVEHNKTFTNSKIAKSLKKALNNSVNDCVFCTSDGFKINAERVNRYLSKYNVTAKDLRGFFANKLVMMKLESDIPKEESERKKKFLSVLDSVSDAVGHTRATLRTHYLLPEVETNYINHGTIKKYEKGGELEKGIKAEQKHIYGDVFAVSDAKQFKQIVNLYNELAKLGVKNYFIDENENSVVFFVDSDIMLYGKDIIEYYLISIKRKGEFGIIDYKKTLPNNELHWFEQTSSLAFKVYLKENLKYETGGELAKGIKAEQEHIGTARKLYNRQITPEQSAKSIAKEHLKENPKYYTDLSKIEKHKEGGSVSSKKFNPDDYLLVIYHEKQGNFMVAKNTIYAWMYDDENASKKLNSGEFDFAMFPPATFGNVFGVPPLLQVWTRKYQSRIKGSNKLIGIVQCWFDEKENKLYVMMMTTKPKYRRKGVNSYIIKTIREKLNLSQDDVFFDKATEEGNKFRQSKKYYRGGKFIR